MIENILFVATLIAAAVLFVWAIDVGGSLRERLRRQPTEDLTPPPRLDRLVADISVPLVEVVLEAERLVTGEAALGPRTTGGGRVVSLYGGEADGYKYLVYDPLPKSIVAAGDVYTPVTDPDTGEFLGAYAKPFEPGPCAYCGQPIHAYDGTHQYEMRTDR